MKRCSYCGGQIATDKHFVTHLFIYDDNGNKTTEARLPIRLCPDCARGVQVNIQHFFEMKYDR